MRGFWTWFVFVSVLTGILGFVRIAHAEDSRAEEADVKPSEDRKGEFKEIGFRITSVNKIDVIKESWELEGILTIASKGRLRKCEAAAIDELFPSGTVTKADEKDEYQLNGLEVRECKITLQEDSDINVARYPFDSHDLDIEVGDEGESIDGVEFRPSANPDATGLGKDVRLSGWEIGPLVPKQEHSIDKHTGAPVTKVVFYLHVRRPLIASFVKGFLAVCFQLLIALVALVLAIKNATNRLALATGALIATATAHNQVSSQIGVAYLTTADKFFFLCYFLLLTNVVLTALMIRAEEAKNERRIKRLWNVAAVILPAMTLIGSALVLGGVV